MTKALTEEERRCLYWLTRMPGFGAVTIDKIWNDFQDKTSIYNIEGRVLQKRGVYTFFRDRDI